MTNTIEVIYEQWHDFAQTRNVAALIDLYSDGAIFESPLVPAIMDQESGVLTGRNEILSFLQEGTKRRPNDLVRWHRTGDYFTNGNTLIWEYPRETPNGDQIDIMEVMEVANGKIVRHRIYWGWFGSSILTSLALNKAKLTS